MMKRIRIITIMICIFPLLSSFGQESSILSQFSALDIKSGKQVISENITMKALEDEDMGLMPEDSLKYKYIEKVYQKRIIRLDLVTVQKSFPEVISITPEGDSILDYTSLIPLLMEAVQEQQILIEDLQKKILSSAVQTK